jgi:hypothetical protein
VCRIPAISTLRASGICGVFDERRARPKRDHRTIINARLRELMHADLAIDERCSHAVLNGKLGFKPSERRRIPHPHPHERMDAQFDALDRVPRSPSRPCSVFVKPRAASSAAMRPLRAAFAMFYDFVMLPCAPVVPAAWLAAMPCPCGAFRVEIKQLRARRSSAENAARRRDMPARVVVLRRDGVADAALDFDTKYERGHCLGIKTGTSDPIVVVFGRDVIVAGLG